MLSVSWLPLKLLCGCCSHWLISFWPCKCVLRTKQQVALNITVTRVETAVRDQPHGGAPHRRRVAADDDDPDYDFIPTVHKLEFPKFDGTGDSLPWLNIFERYFHVQRTPEHRRVTYATFHLLEDAQEWFHRLELNRASRRGIASTSSSTCASGHH
jgi:hypothetical protein